METLQHALLSVVIFFPVVAAAAVMLVGRQDGSNAREVKRLAIALSIVELAISLPLAVLFKAGQGYQFDLVRPWISAAGLNVSYHVGLDGLSLWLVLLSTFTTPVA